MDSINQQQAEKNREDLQRNEAGKKIKELVEKNETCFFCTKMVSGKPFTTRPMAVQKVDEKGNFWFLSADDSHKNLEVKIDDHVQLLFQGSPHSDFLSVFGTATVSKDKKMIKELWKPILRAWFTEGEHDPRITVIKVEAKEGYYWDNKHGNAVAFIKTIAGSITGKTMDDSIEGKLKL